MTNTGYIRVRVKTEAKKETVTRKGDMFYISVKEKAKEGNANARIKIILSQMLHCMPSRLRMIKGATSPSKTYLLSKNT